MHTPLMQVGVLAVGVVSFILLLIGSLFLTFLAVIVDRFNFDYKPFYPKRIRVVREGDKRDRTGAHVIQKLQPDSDDS